MIYYDVWFSNMADLHFTRKYRWCSNILHWEDSWCYIQTYYLYQLFSQSNSDFSQDLSDKMPEASSTRGYFTYWINSKAIFIFTSMEMLINIEPDSSQLEWQKDIFNVTQELQTHFHPRSLQDSNLNLSTISPSRFFPIFAVKSPMTFIISCGFHEPERCSVCNRTCRFLISCFVLFVHIQLQ